MPDDLLIFSKKNCVVAAQHGQKATKPSRSQSILCGFIWFYVPSIFAPKCDGSMSPLPSLLLIIYFLLLLRLDLLFVFIITVVIRDVNSVGFWVLCTHELLE